MVRLSRTGLGAAEDAAAAAGDATRVAKEAACEEEGDGFTSRDLETRLGHEGGTEVGGAGAGGISRGAPNRSPVRPARQIRQRKNHMALRFSPASVVIPMRKQRGKARVKEQKEEKGTLRGHK